MKLETTAAIYITIAGMLLVGQIGEVLPQGSCPVTLNQFYYLGNNTCINCPPSCLTCYPQVADDKYPCATCPQNSYFQRKVTENGRFDGVAGVCNDCSKVPGLIKSDGSKRLTIVKIPPNSNNVQNPPILGRLQVYYFDRYGSVCDDGWTMENTHVACRELGLGKGLSFHPRFDYNYTYLAKDPILIDNVQCQGTEDSIFMCKHKGPMENNCGPIESIGITCTGPDNTKRCVRDCPVGQFLDQSSMSCQPCDRTCLECTGSSTHCINCEEGLFLRYDNNCITECGVGFYGNVERRQCQPCSTACRTCADGRRSDICTGCPDAMKLLNSICVKTCPTSTYLYEGDILQCLEACPPGHLAESGLCVKCAAKCDSCSVTPDNCTQCQTSFVLQLRETSRLQTRLSLGSCQLSCDAGHYPDPFFICRRCRQVACESCHPGGVFCKTCQAGYFSEMNECTRQCSKGLFPNKGMCLSECENGYYGNMDSGRCEACPPNCQHCEDIRTCRKCSDGFYVYQGECVTDCGEGMMSVGAPHNRLVRLAGGLSDNEGRVEIYYKGIWGHVCGSTWDVTNANVVCKELGLGKALKVTQDVTFGSSGLALSGNIRCHGNETTLLSCMHDIPAAFTYCNDRVAGVYCSGPGPEDVRACRVRNSASCAVSPCFQGVTCTNYPEGDAAYVQGSYCGPCPPGFEGTGVQCQKVKVTESVISYPAVKEMQVSYWPEGVRIDLACVTNNVTHVTFTWLKDEMILENTQFYRISNRGTLTIFEPRGRADSALYTCIVSNGDNKISVFYKLSVQEKIDITTTGRPIKGNGRFSLPCDVIGYPPANVTWYKDGTKLQEGGNYQMDKTTLVILRANKAADTGNYTCVAHNQFTSKSSITPVEIIAPVQITDRPKNMVAVFGRSFDYTCVTEGAPQPRVYWKKDGQDIVNSSRIWSNDKGRVYIQSVEIEDGGEYTCVATADGLSVETWSVNITVLELPAVSITPALLSISTTASAIFACTARGQPVPHVRWIVPSRNILATSETVEDSGRSELTLSDVIPSDAGAVICMASNSAGQVNATAILEVKYAPVFLKQPEAVFAQRGWPLLLPWTVNAVPPPSIYLFKDNINITDEVTLQSSGVYIPAEFPLTSGNMVLRANNSQGDLLGQALLTVVNTLPNLKVEHKTLTTVTLNMHKIPQQPRGVTHEIWVINLGENTTYIRVPFSPISLQESEDDPNRILKYAIFSKLPELVTIGSNSSEDLPVSRKRRVVQEGSPLSPSTWYAICLRVMTLDPTYARPTVPVAATEYLYVYTENAEAAAVSSSSSMAGWKIALIVIGTLLLLALVIFFIIWGYSCSNNVDWHAPVRWLKGFSNKRSLSVEGPLDVEAVLDQFNPQLSRGRLKRSQGVERGKPPAKQEVVLQNSPALKSQVTVSQDIPNNDPTDVRIQSLRRPLVMEQDAIYKSPSKKALSESYITSQNSQSHFDAYLSSSDPQLATANHPFLQNAKEAISDEYKEHLKAHNSQHKNDSEFSESKKSDSGVESDNIPNIKRIEKSRQKDITAMMGYHNLVKSEIKRNKRKFIPAAWRHFYMRKKGQRKAGKSSGDYEWGDEEGNFLSWSKKWARQMMERGHYSDDDSIISSRSGDSDIEMHMIPDASPNGRQLRRAFTHDSIHDLADADLNHSYADLSDIHPLSRRGKHAEVTYTNPGFQPDDPSSPVPSSSHTTKKPHYSESKKPKSSSQDVHITQAFIHSDAKASEDSPGSPYDSKMLDTECSNTPVTNTSPSLYLPEENAQDAYTHEDSFSEISPADTPETYKEEDVSPPVERESGDGQASHGSTTSPTSHSSHGYITLIEAKNGEKNNENKVSGLETVTGRNSISNVLSQSQSSSSVMSDNQDTSTVHMPSQIPIEDSNSVSNMALSSNLPVFAYPSTTDQDAIYLQHTLNQQNNFLKTESTLPNLKTESPLTNGTEKISQHMGETTYVEIKPSLIDISRPDLPNKHSKKTTEYSNKSFNFPLSRQTSETEIIPIVESSRPGKLHIPDIFK